MAREVRDIAMLVARSFQADEAAAWQRLEAADRVRGFFLLWTAREAAMKCAGLGLAKGGSITRVDPAVLREDEVGARVGAARMRVRRMEAPEGYVMALARA
jgi:phosphopantetheinyl transferase